MNTLVSITLQARDIQLIISLMGLDPRFEKAYDAIKTSFRGANPPQPQADVKLDNIPLSFLLSVSETLRTYQYRFVGTAYVRIHQAITTVANNQPLLATEIGKLNTSDTNAYNAAIAKGLDILKNVY